MSIRSICALATATLGFALSANAAVITVDTFEPTRSRCNLAAAIAAAESNVRVNGCMAGEAGGADVIRFLPQLAGTAVLAPSTRITGSVSIIGNGADQVRVDGTLVIDLPDDGTFSLANLEMRSGLLVGRAGEVAIDGIRFAQLPAGRMHNGSAIDTPMAQIGRLSIRDSEFVDNTGYLGVVVLSPTARVDNVEIHRSRFIDNHPYGPGAGALYIGSQTSQVSIVASDFVNNRSVDGLAGALAVDRPASLSITASVFDSNEGGEAGAIWAYGGELDLVNSSLTRNLGREAAALYMLGGNRFGLRFSSVVDNGMAGGAPALNLDTGPGLSEFLGSVLRAPQGGRVCGSAPLQSLGFNQEYGHRTCALHGQDDISQLPWHLSAVEAGAGRSRVPAPLRAGPGVDRVPYYACRLPSQETIATDVRGVGRPWSHGFADPYGWCDVGPVEKHPDDPAFPVWF